MSFIALIALVTRRCGAPHAGENAICATSALSSVQYESKLIICHEASKQHISVFVSIDSLYLRCSRQTVVSGLLIFTQVVFCLLLSICFVEKRSISEENGDGWRRTRQSN